MTIPEERQLLLDALRKLFGFTSRDVARFVAEWNPGEIDDALEHLQLAENPIVGVAAVLYGVRCRLANGDRGLLAAAASEAVRLAKLFPVPPPNNVRRVVPESTRRLIPDPVWDQSESDL